MLGLYSWGANSHGQLGLGYSSEMVCDPMRVEELPAQLCEATIASIVGGGGHTLLLSTAGSLYGTGWNNCGQVGDGTASRCVPCFRECRGLEGQTMVGVACGWAHSVACSDTGHVWVWGSNTHGQLGLPPNEVPFSSLPICLELADVVSVSAGLRHTAVSTRNGEVYTWGHGHRGQLGHLSEDGSTLRTQTAPKLLETLETKVSEVLCGQNTTYALTCDGAVLAWGDNKWGQLGHDPGNMLFFTCPLTIPSNYFGGEKVLWLRCGWTHVVGGTVAGLVYIWGRGDYGQLGPTPTDDDDCSSTPIITSHEDTAPQDIKNIIHTPKYRYIPSVVTVEAGLRVQHLVCGSEHTLALVSKLTAQRRQSLPAQQLCRRIASSSSVNSETTSFSNDTSTLQRQQVAAVTTSSSREEVIHTSGVEACTTDSGTVSSASDNSVVGHKLNVGTSNSHTSDTLPYPVPLPTLQNLKSSEFDQPCTLSPIDSPRTLVQSTSSLNSDRIIAEDLENMTLDQCKLKGQRTNIPLKNKSLNALHQKSGLLPGVTFSSSLDNRGVVSGYRNNSVLYLQETLCSELLDCSSIEYPCIYSWGWNEHGNCGVGITDNVLMPRRVPVDGTVIMVAAGSGHSFALIKKYNKVSI